MLFNHLYYVCRGILYLTLFILACMSYTYVVNLRRKADDPDKQDYHPFAIILAPFTLPFFLTLGIFVFIIRALLFAVFLAIFTILLVAIRKPFVFVLWHKFATKIGHPLLKVNTRLIKMAFSPWNEKPQAV